MSYFSPTVIRYTPQDTTKYVSPEKSNGAVKAPRFSIFPVVLKAGQTGTADSSGKLTIYNAKDVELATKHAFFRLTSILFTTVGMVGLAALGVIAIKFSAILLPSTALTLGLIFGAYTLVGFAIAAASKASLKNELVYKPKVLKEATYQNIAPVNDRSKVAYKPNGAVRPTQGYTYTKIADTEQKTIKNEKIAIYEEKTETTANGKVGYEANVEVSRKHRIARIIAVTLLAVAIVATVALIVLAATSNPILHAIPLIIAIDVIGAMYVLAFMIHTVSIKSIKNEVVQITKRDLVINCKYAKDQPNPTDFRLYKNLDLSQLEDSKKYFVTVQDKKEMDRYRDNYQLTQTFVDWNHNNAKNNRPLTPLKKNDWKDSFNVLPENSFLYKIGGLFC